MDERALDELRALARRDAELGARASRLRELDSEVGALRGRAEEIDRFFASYPAGEAARRAAVERAEAEVDRRRRERAEAEAAVEAARDDEQQAHARHALTRAADHVEVAEAARTRAVAEQGALEREAASLPREVPHLEQRAAAVAAAADAVPEPPTGLRELAAWASHAHAELFVAAGHLDTQRERVIREANELASMLLGEPTYGSTPGQALERVEQRA